MADSGIGATHRPVRTCIGCRERAGRDELLRVVVEGGQIQPDPHAVLPGRGAWLHPGCLDAAERRRAFSRALRVSGPVDLSRLRTWISP